LVPEKLPSSFQYGALRLKTLLFQDRLAGVSAGFYHLFPTFPLWNDSTRGFFFRYLRDQELSTHRFGFPSAL